MSTLATHPYVAVWLGNVGPIRGRRGELSAHKRPDLAVRACKRQRDELRPLWGSHIPWFVYQVIDARDGRVVSFIS